MDKRILALSMGNNSAPAPQPIFLASLVTGVVASRPGTGLTYTRATPATIEDVEGKITPVLSGETRHRGNRRVYNLIPAAGSGSASLAIAANKTITVGVGTFVYSMAAGAGGICTFTGTATGSTGTLTQNATNRTARTLTITAGGTIIMTASVAILTDLQIENVTGQTNQNPSEYVSIGVLSSPFHGNFVDGVRYFQTFNGNTVAANIVTEAVGLQINTTNCTALGLGSLTGLWDAKGPRGYLPEEAATNLCLQSEDFSNASWGKTAATIGGSVTLPNGATGTVNKIQEDNTSAAHLVNQVFAKAASLIAYTQSAYVKASERSWIRMSMDDGGPGNGVIVWFNVSTGTIGTTTPVGAAPFTSISTSITAAANGFYRCIVSATSSAGVVLNFTVCSTIGDTVTVFTGTTGSGVFIWGAQLETGGRATTYIPTTTAAVTRNADVLLPTFAFPNTAGTVYVEAGFSGMNGANNNVLVQGSAAEGSPVFIQSATSIATFDGTTTLALTAGSPSTTAMNRMSVAWNGTAAKGALNAVLGSAVVTDGNYNIGATFGIGCNTAGAGQPGDPIRNLEIYNIPLTDAQQLARGA